MTTRQRATTIQGYPKLLYTYSMGAGLYRVSKQVHALLEPGSDGNFKWQWSQSTGGRKPSLPVRVYGNRLSVSSIGDLFDVKGPDDGSKL